MEEKLGWYHQLTKLLIYPSDEVSPLAERRKAKLLAAMTLFFVIANGASNSLTFIFFPSKMTPFLENLIISLVIEAFVVGMYLLSRTRWYQVALYLTIIGVSVAIFAASIPHSEVPDEVNLLVYLPLPILMSSILLSWKTSLKIGLVNLAVLLLFPILFLDGDFSLVVDIQVFFVVMVLGINIATYYWGVLERDRRASLVQNEQMLRMTTENIQDVIALVDNEGKYRYLSPSFERVTGHDTDYAIQQSASFWGKFIHPDDLPTVRQKFKIALRNHLPITYEYRFQQAEGNYIWFETTANPIKDEIGDPSGVILVSRDITQRKHNEENELRLALQHERISTLEKFISNMSHDLKTPISVLNTSIYLLEKQQSQEKRQHRLDVLKQQASHLEQLIEDMLTIVRLDNDTSYKLVEVEARDLLHTLQKRFHEVALQKELTLKLVIAEGTPPIHVDLEKISLAFNAIVQNALVYTPQYGSITLFAAPHHEGVVIEVQDTGLGIDEKDLGHIFERFYRADAARSANTGGTGLGLAIARKIVETHRGKIEADSTPGVGTTFRITLPVKEEVVPVLG